MDNTYKGKKLEFHILQSFPVTCLNRDDVGDLAYIQSHKNDKLSSFDDTFK